MAAHELLRNLSDKVDPSRAVVLTIDVQNDFFHDQGYMGRLGVPLGSIQGMVPKLQSFLAAARLAEVPVMHVVSHHDEQYASVVVTEQKLRAGHDLTSDGRTMKDAAYCRQGTFGVEQYEIKALPGEDHREAPLQRLPRHRFGPVATGPGRADGHRHRGRLERVRGVHGP